MNCVPFFVEKVLTPPSWSGRKKKIAFAGTSQKITWHKVPNIKLLVTYVVLTFEDVDEILMCDHSNESYWAVLSCHWCGGTLGVLLYNVVLTFAEKIKPFNPLLSAHISDNPEGLAEDLVINCKQSHFHIDSRAREKDEASTLCASFFSYNVPAGCHYRA